MSIGSRIKERREELGMTQVELAKIIGVSKGSVGNYECGVSAPNEKILYKIFSALKCDANFLYQDDMLILSNTEEFKINSSEKTIIKKYRSLDPFGQKAVDSIISVEYERCANQKENNVTILSTTAARTTTNEQSIKQEHIKDLSKVKPDKSEH